MITALVAGLGACGRFGPAEGAVRVAKADPAASIEAQRAQLREVVAGQLSEAERQAGSDKNSLIAKEPYYYKEYSTYPGSADDADITLRELETRAAPFIADVRLDKVRYSTRLNRDKGDARNDQNFLRDTGMETVTYELRGGYWIKVGTLFVAEKTEEYVNGEWVPTQEEVRRTVAIEREKGWFGRTLDSITGIF
jgi:hypothetical protein